MKAAESDYVVNPYGGGVEITKYTGNSKNLIIPSKIGGKKVTRIGNYAFAGCTGLINVEIPNDVTSIGEDAFFGCSNITSVKIPSGLRSIEGGAFSQCNSMASLELPDTLTSIGDAAFLECGNLTAVIIPEAVTSIGEDAFDGCSRITSLEIPESVKSIGAYAFSDCNGLETIKVAEGNTVYDSRQNCNAIVETGSARLMFGCKNTKIPDGVASIRAGAFAGCSSLTSMELPNSVISIEEAAFSDCSRLISVEFPGSLASIGNAAFLGCSSLESLKLPNSLASIGDNVFFRCINLTSVELPDSMATIGSGAFSECRRLAGIRLPNNVAIGESAFSGCISLMNVEIPKSVANMKGNAFWGCSSLESIRVAEGNEKYDSRENCNAIIETETNRLISGCKNTKIPDSILGIGMDAFRGCSGLTSVEIPNGVTSIGYGAFLDCSGLRHALLPDSLTDIQADAFGGCTALTDMVIPSSVVTVGGDFSNVFLGCSSLESLKVEEGNSVYDSREDCNAIIKTEDSRLVAGCKNTKIPGSITSIGEGAFSGCSGLADVEIPGRVSFIENNAFSGCSGLTSLELPSNVLNIGYHAFWGCGNLTDIKVAEGNKKYDSRENCNAIVETESSRLILGCKNTKIPNNVTSIGQGAFLGCTGLTGIEIPSSVTEIEYQAFDHCSGLENLKVAEGNKKYDSREDCNAIVETKNNRLILGCKNTRVPNSVTIIGAGAFKDCTGLTDIELPNSIVNIEGDAFLGCDRLTSIELPGSIASIGYAAIGFMQEGWERNRVPDFLIYGISGSEAERYAKDNEIRFESIGMLLKDISKAAVTLEKSSYSYDGKPKTPSVTVKLEGKNLLLGTDYTVSYSNNTKIGTATVTVTGKGSYTGSKSVNFVIKKAAGQEKPDSSIICKKTVYKVTYGAKPFKINASSKEKLSFTSSSQKVAIVDKKTGKVSIRGTGVATITIKAGKTSVKVTVKVNPKKQAMKSIKPAKGRKLAITWAKDKMTSGYQVQASTDKKFKKDVKSKNVTKPSYTFTKLKVGKKYYVRLRSYKKSGKETLYGAWSSIKKSGAIKK